MTAEAPRALLERIKRERRGMLSLPVYRALYQAAAETGGGTLIEIGTAYGAAATTLAFGARSGGAPFHLFTVDSYDSAASRRWRRVSAATATAELRDGLTRFGIEADVTIVSGDVTKLVAAHEPRDIGLLLIDADGRIYRDLAPLLDRLRPGAIVIIDDADGEPAINFTPDGPLLDLKHRLTRLLLDGLVERDVLRIERMVHQTAFCRAGTVRLDPAQWQQLALDAYRQLVITEIDPRWFGNRAHLRRLSERHAPWLISAARRLRPR